MSPTMTEAPSGTGNEYICKSNTGAAAMALGAASNRINKTDCIHTAAGSTESEPIAKKAKESLSNLVPTQDTSDY